MTKDELIKKLWDKAFEYDRKSRRAKTQDRSDYWWARYRMLSKYLAKSTLISSYYKSFGQPADWAKQYKLTPERWKQNVAARKEMGRLDFLHKYYYAPWFNSNSVSADYGTYTCDRCGRTFYHSPSTITKAAKEVYHCCCGYCTNEVIGKDHGSKPYN